MTVETLFHFRTGGELKWTLGGLLLGALISVTPAELAPGLFALPVLGFHFLRLSRHGGRSAHVLFMVAVFGVMALALAAPTKPGDRRVNLYASRLALSELARQVGIAGDAPATVITLPSGSPTLREIDEAIEQQSNLRVRRGYCGNGMNLLFGAYPMRAYLEPAR